MNPYFSRLLPVALMATLLLVAACGDTPDTDRTRLNFLDPDEEARRGIAEFNAMKTQLRIYENPQINQIVQKVGHRLAKVIPVSNAQWEFVIFDDPAPNAFALPGGKVGINTGLFEIAENEAGLAAVIGHEVAHIVARHSGERLTRGVISAGAVAAGSYYLNKKAEVDPRLASLLLSGFAAVNYKAHSREQELEADRLGSLYMARAGFDPCESVRLWERFAAYRERTGLAEGSSLLRSHPVDSLRIEKLKEYLPHAMKEYRPL
ncbi:MAG: M48 family metallopeptidase [Verrucomicrobiales bacterium]|nr:M48 family metallopeptidase [Verrucomicrobiales bacterium]